MPMRGSHDRLCVLDQLLGCGARDLGGNGEPARRMSAVGDDEGVDADQFAVRIDERAAELPD